jgi:hypothetical protein
VYTPSQSITVKLTILIRVFGDGKNGEDSRGGGATGCILGCLGLPLLLS